MKSGCFTQLALEFGKYYSLENSRDGGAWWAAVYRVAQSRTRLKQLSSSSSSSRELIGFPGGLLVKNPPANTGDKRDAGLIPGSGQCPGGGHGNPLQYSFLENPMDRGAWLAPAHGVLKSQTQLKRLSIHSRTCTYSNSASVPSPLPA